MSSDRTFDLKKIREDFPFFADPTTVGYHYLDNAVTSQKPAVVIDTMAKQMRQHNANIHRGVYRLSEHTTGLFEATRKKVAAFFGGVKPEEVIFTSGTTAAINLVSHSYGEAFIKKGDEILLTTAEHHSNIVPWQLLAQKTQATLKYIPLDEHYRLDLAAAKNLFNEKTKLFAFNHVSNVLGTINPVKELCAMARAVGAVTLVDGAQAAPHLSIDVRDLGCDFYVMSAHKMLGPTGLGVLYGREALLEAMPPFMGGGQMISRVDLEQSTWAALPHKFEAGTPPIIEVIGFAAALDYLQQFSPADIHRHILSLSSEVVTRMRQEFPEIRVFVDSFEDWIGIVSFYHPQVHPHDLAAFQDSFNVCIRAGHHCAQPLMRHLKIDSSSRLSPYLYSTPEDIEQFFAGLHHVKQLY